MFYYFFVGFFQVTCLYAITENISKNNIKYTKILCLFCILLFIFYLHIFMYVYITVYFPL